MYVRWYLPNMYCVSSCSALGYRLLRVRPVTWSDWWPSHSFHFMWVKLTPVIIITFCVICVAAVALKSRTLQLIKWRDAEGREQTFRLVDLVSARWMEFGTLLGFTLNVLEGWEKEYHCNSSRCWMKVMDSWVEKGSCDYPVTWEGLCTLLRDMGLPDVRHELIQALCKSCS